MDFTNSFIKEESLVTVSFIRVLISFVTLGWKKIGGGGNNNCLETSVNNVCDWCTNHKVVNKKRYSSLTNGHFIFY